MFANFYAPWQAGRIEYTQSEANERREREKTDRKSIDEHKHTVLQKQGAQSKKKVRLCRNAL